MRAVVSDLHANKEALEAVLRDISAQGVDEIWCLGDVVGYGPDPIDCVDLVMWNCTLCLMGNHDWAVVNAPVGFNSAATRMVYQTKLWMQLTEESTEQERARWDFLANLPLRRSEGGRLLVHASPRAELTEYILPNDVRYDQPKLQEIMQMFEGVCMVGHTHIPCCITEDLELILPEGNGFTVELGQKKMIVNIGSVGQPRDGDKRACYVTLEDGLVRYHRVEYRLDKTVDKISALGEEFEVLGYRLTIGR